MKSILKVLFLLLTTVLLPSAGLAQSLDYTRWVNPFIGTGGHGHTFPGATMPFGMVQLSPDTRIDNWDGSSGYHYSDDTIYGFSHTHLSGTGIPDGCDILFMPLKGKNSNSGVAPRIGATNFSHSNERAEPGYYSVKLDNGILAEMTASSRVGVHRYTFPENEEANLWLDLKWRDTIIGSQITFVNSTRIEGFRRSRSWAKDQTVYFVAEFSKPFKYWAVYEGGNSVRTDEGYPFDSKEEVKAMINGFPRNSRQLTLKVAISYVSIEGARKNLAAELPGWDFDKVRADAKAAWNKELSKIEVSGGTDAQTTTFYTALYHTMIQPNVLNDVDGSYLGLDKRIHNIGSDGKERTTPSAQSGGHPSFVRRGAGKNPKSKIQNPKSGDQYTVFSLWDTFRAAHPLYTIIDQKRTVDFINTFIRQYEQGGRLPVWELWGEETDTMIGYHAVSVIADAMAKGIKGFDYDKAYAAAKHSAELDHFGLAAYKKRGYISMEDENESVSKTLEYAYDDWCISQMATSLRSYWLKRSTTDAIERSRKYGGDAELYSKRARYFENLFDPTTGFMRPKKNGGFVSPFAPNEVTFNFTEGNSWVYSFFVPHDIKRLIELQGGSERFAAKLDELFTTKDKLAGREQPDITGLIGQYAHGNEPSHHIAYLYNYAGQPWKTQKYVRQILNDFYKPTPDGLIGNEDCGQMSAWYILSASGFYPVAPGAPTYSLGTPLFPRITYHLENGKTFTIKAPAVVKPDEYLRAVEFNGKGVGSDDLTHGALMAGGMLEFRAFPIPPVAEKDGLIGTGDNFVAVPRIEGRPVFDDRAYIFLRTTTRHAKIFYTTDGRDPVKGSWTLYDAPFRISQTTIVKAVSIGLNGDRSLIADGKFIKKPNNWTVAIDSKYNRQYTGGGDEGLIDGIRGTVNFASGEWQGYQPQDLVATIDLQKETTVSKLGGGFLQNARSWIWMPTRIEFELSIDGVNFTRVADIKTDIDTTDMKEQIRDFVQSISPVKARYVRIHAHNLGKIPSWHPGAGEDAFIFVDEIIVQ